MTQVVVDLLEVVEVNNEECKFRPVALSAMQSLVKTVAQKMAVG